MIRKPKKTNRRMVKRPQLYRKRRSIIDWAVIAGKISLIGAGVFLVYHLFLVSSYFKLQTVELTKAPTHISESDLLKIAQIPYGANILGINLYQIVQNIKRYPWVQQVYLRRQLPNKLKLHITEHQVMAIIFTRNQKPKPKRPLKKSEMYTYGDMYYMNFNGELFKKLSSQDSIDYPLITGFSKQRLEKYPGFYRGPLKEVFSFLQKYQAKKKLYDFFPIRLHYDMIAGIRLTVVDRQTQKRTQIYFGKDHFDDKLNQWQQFAAVVKKENTAYKKIDLHIKGKVFAQR